jgi:ABC-type glutathione transport system ATPase component
MEERTRRLIEEPLLKVDDLVVEFRMDRRRMIQAVAGVNFEIGVGESLAGVGFTPDAPVHKVSAARLSPE